MSKNKSSFQIVFIFPIQMLKEKHFMPTDKVVTVLRVRYNQNIPLKV